MPPVAQVRVAGWIAHIRKQAADNRPSRPRAHYADPTIQSYVPLEERHKDDEPIRMRRAIHVAGIMPPG